MEKIKIYQNKPFGEIRIGIDKDTSEEACITLALNHWENDEQWGGQPLNPKLAREIGCVLIEYAAKAEAIQQKALNRVSEMR